MIGYMDIYKDREQYEYRGRDKDRNRKIDKQVNK